MGGAANPEASTRDQPERRTRTIEGTASEQTITPAAVPVLATTDLLIVAPSLPPPQHDERSHGDRTGKEKKQKQDGGAVARPEDDLAAGLAMIMQRISGEETAEWSWLSWGSDEEAARTTASGEERSPPAHAYVGQSIILPAEIVEGADEYRKRMLWPLCHGGLLNLAVDGQAWQCYEFLNNRIADAVSEHATADTVVWLDGPNLALAPRQVHRTVPADTSVLTFWRDPWPEWDSLRACPHHRGVLEGLLGADLLGFQSERYCTHFFDCVHEVFPEAFLDRKRGRIRYNDHLTVVKTFPQGIDAAAIRRESTAVSKPKWKRFRRRRGIPLDSKLALGVDRIKPTAGLVERLASLERFWTTRPEWRGNLTYLQYLSEGRALTFAPDNTSNAEIDLDSSGLQSTIRKSVARVNDRFGTSDWQPIVCLDESLSRIQRCGLYRYSDLLLMSTLRAGVSLVAKEYIAAQVAPDEGVLVLSDRTGTHDELGTHALTINPYDTAGIAVAIETAVTMGTDERRARMQHLRQRVGSYDLIAWLADMLETSRTLDEDQKQQHTTRQQASSR